MPNNKIEKCEQTTKKPLIPEFNIKYKQFEILLALY